jgi:3-oxoacyl-[acyl-carrier-protein] synthase II
MLFSLTQWPNSTRRVVITGAGLVTALGQDWRSNAQGFRTGRTAFRPVTLFDVSRQRVKNAAEVDLPGVLPRTGLSQRHLSRMDRASKLLLLAADQAWGQAGWRSGCRLPVVLGTTSGGMSLGEAYLKQFTREPQNHCRQAGRVVHYQCQRQGLDLADAFGFTGPVIVIANACASGANAIGHAWELLRFGSADRALAGGYDALSQLVFAGFDSLQTLSPTCCRPFDCQRDGLALGEGAAVFALESLETAHSRGVKILAELVGYGTSTDAHHLTQPHPEGAAALLAMTAACRAAGIEPAQVGYVNAHGTGTLLNDSAEAFAINRWAGDGAPTLPVSSTKSSIGHLLGGAGAAEAAVCLMALEGQWLPPTCTCQKPDPTARFTLVTQPRSASIEFALSNSFGFGGANASLILRRWS